MNLGHANNSTTPGTLSAAISDVMKGTDQPTLADLWDQTTQNLTSGPQKDEQTDILNFLPSRMVVIACVIVALFIIAWASYNVHKKCVKDSQRHKYHKSMLL